MINYSLNESTGVFIRDDYHRIGYADGAENELLNIINSSTDRSTFSYSLKSKMVDWPTEYHLSRKRHLIVRSIGIKPGDRVLELGCGCGAVTRYLAEIGASVIAVEGELDRAAVAAKRCSEFPNVKIVSDNILDLCLNERFDWILMIGVFEYSQKYGRTSNPQEEYLAITKSHLASNGTLVIAIENKLGLKYINGAGEDHNGNINYGPHDLYDNKDITTWGRGELSRILKECGFNFLHFSGVFPDYKLPKIILDEKIDSCINFRAEELLLYSRSLDYRGQNSRHFDEALAAASFRKNEQLIEFSNSFLVRAKIDSPIDDDSGHLATYYAVDRKNEFCTTTRFSYAEGEVEVERRLIFESDPDLEQLIYVTTDDGSLLPIVHNFSHCVTQYFPGELLGYRFSKALARRDFSQIGNIISLWADYINRHFKFYNRITRAHIAFTDLKGFDLKDVLIDGESLDCGPHNIIAGPEISSFDLEWISTVPIPFSWMLYRNCNHILRENYGQSFSLELIDLVGLTSDFFGTVATVEDIEVARNIESQFQDRVSYVEPSSTVKLTTASFR